MTTSNAASRKKRRRRKPLRRGSPAENEALGTSGESPAAPSSRGALPKLAVVTAILTAVFLWCYWPTFENLVSAWDKEPDYSHGYFVIPLAIVFLWLRRDRFPGLRGRLAPGGLVLIGLSIAARLASARYYVDAIDGWSLILWVAGVVWLLGGLRVFWWSLPSVAFLWFMVPLPYRAERWLSLPLQRIAAKGSCWVLQSLGQPALDEWNIIVIGQHQLEVARACSGLRIFVGIFALAFAYVVIVRRPWWMKALLLASALPIALVANATRIVVMGLLCQLVSSEAAGKFSHDMAGYVMIPFAAGLFALVLWYLGKITREVELVGVGAAVRRERL